MACLSARSRARIMPTPAAGTRRNRGHWRHSRQLTMDDAVVQIVWKLDEVVKVEVIVGAVDLAPFRGPIVAIRIDATLVPSSPFTKPCAFTP